MILTCPQCETRYLLPATVLGEEGRRVKCSSCAEVWHQLPDPDELAEFQEADEAEQESEEPPLEDIPEAVKPIPEGSSVPALQDDDKDKGDLRAMLGGFASAAAVFIIIFAGLYFAHKPIVSIWPASSVFYERLGKSMPVSGEGLVFDHLAVKAQSDGEMETITVEGQVINLTSHDQIVPLIEASLKDDHDEVLEKWIINAPEKHLDAEGVLPFSSEHKAHKTSAENVHLRFVLKAGKPPKTAAEDAGSTEAPHGDDHAPPHGGATSEESHEPASSQPH